MKTSLHLHCDMPGSVVFRSEFEIYAADLTTFIFIFDANIWKNDVSVDNRKAMLKGSFDLKFGVVSLRIPYTESADVPLSEFLQRFLDFYKTEGRVALRTWQDYRYHIEENIVPGIGGVTLKDLKPLAVDEWMKSLRDRGLGNRTVEYAQAVLRRALQFAVEWEILDLIETRRRRAFGRQSASESQSRAERKSNT